MDLVILAGGMGSRFGGLKQITPIDEDYNFILDYSVHDAVKVGFDRVILIIKDENYEYFKSTIGKRLEKIVKVEYAFQNLNVVPVNFVVPEERIKPWGTAHALYCAKDIVADKFAVINADDFYGFESFKLIADFLNNSKENEFISAGFQVKNTLSDKGTVKRGIFTLSEDVAMSLEESEVKNVNGRLFATRLNQNRWREIDENTLVSMTMFGFTKKLVKKLEEGFEKFFKQPKGNLIKGEYLLPDVVNEMIDKKEIQMKVKMTQARWHGITYRDDLISFVNAVKQMKRDSKYPQHLY